MQKSTIVAPLVVLIVLLLGASRPAAAQFYRQHNLVSDGSVPTRSEAMHVNLTIL